MISQDEPAIERLEEIIKMIARADLVTWASIELILYLINLDEKQEFVKGIAVVEDEDKTGEEVH